MENVLRNGTFSSSMISLISCLDLACGVKAGIFFERTFGLYGCGYAPTYHDCWIRYFLCWRDDCGDDDNYGVWHLITAGAELGAIWDPLGGSWRQFCERQHRSASPAHCREANNRNMTLMGVGGCNNDDANDYNESFRWTQWAVCWEEVNMVKRVKVVAGLNGIRRPGLSNWSMQEWAVFSVQVWPDQLTRACWSHRCPYINRILPQRWPAGTIYHA